MLAWIFIKKREITSDAPKNESRLIQIIRMGESIRHKLVNIIIKDILPIVANKKRRQNNDCIDDIIEVHMAVHLRINLSMN